MGRAAERGLETLTAFNEREPWVADQIGNRFIGIGHVFPGYTLPVIHDMEYGLWVMLALLGPCGLTVCPLDYHACMRDLSVDRVEQAARDKLNRSTVTGNEAA